MTVAKEHQKDAREMQHVNAEHQTRAETTMDKQ